MLANQSRHSVQFSDLAWEDDAPQFPRAWQVGKYLERYQSRYLDGNPDFELRLKSRVTKVEKRDGGSAGWTVHIQSGDQQESRDFDYLVIASGYFGKPIIPECFKNAKTAIPIIHSSQYRDLKGLLGEGKEKGGKILIVGGQMSGVEIAGTIGSHLSSAVHSPEKSEIAGIDKYSIHHAIQRPIWVFPLYTTPEVGKIFSIPHVGKSLTNVSQHLQQHLSPPWIWALTTSTTGPGRWRIRRAISAKSMQTWCTPSLKHHLVIRNSFLRY